MSLLDRQPAGTLRRAGLWLLLLGTALALRPELPADVVTITHGPLLGGVADRWIKIWIRSSGPAAFRVRYWPSGDPTHVHEARGEPLVDAHDFTGVATLRGLAPGTSYQYRVSLERARAGAQQLGASFRTLPTAGTPSKLRFVVAADLLDRNPPGFDEMRALRPDFAILLGDNIYRRHDKSLEGLRAVYREMWGAPRARKFFERVPTLMIWDDHELTDNYWRGRMDARAARRAFDEYQGSHNPDPITPGALYFQVSAGDAELFVLDARSYRDPNTLPDGPNKSMLGPTQRAAVMAWLEHSRARWKLLGTSVTLGHTTSASRDGWNAFDSERRMLIEHLAKHDVGNVLALAGDMHWSALQRFDHPYEQQVYRFYELLATPLAAPNRGAPRAANPELLTHDDRKRVFGVVDLDSTITPATLTLTMCAVRKRCRPGSEPSPLAASNVNRLPWSLTLHESDFGLRPAPPATAAN